MPLLLLFADLLTAPSDLPPARPPLPPVPPVEGRPLLAWPRGTAVPVRRAVCCFWPAIEEYTAAVRLRVVLFLSLERARF